MLLFYMIFDDSKHEEYLRNEKERMKRFMKKYQRHADEIKDDSSMTG